MRRARPLEDVVRGPRTDKVNERYYARNNEPSFYQFNNSNTGYHFYDAEGRLYRIASENNDEFQNLLLRGPSEQQQRQDCVVDTFGHVLLYVKLRHRTSRWFDENALERPVTLFTHYSASRTPEEYRVRIQSTIKPDYKRRTGAITVSGLSRQLCRLLLSVGAGAGVGVGAGKK